MITKSTQTTSEPQTIAMQLLSRGREEGRQEGRQEGRKEARQEYQKELVIQLIKEGMDNIFIHRLTQLSEIQITELRESTSIS